MVLRVVVNFKIFPQKLKGQRLNSTWTEIINNISKLQQMKTTIPGHTASPAMFNIYSASGNMHPLEGTHSSKPASVTVNTVASSMKPRIWMTNKKKLTKCCSEINSRAFMAEETGMRLRLDAEERK